MTAKTASQRVTAANRALHKLIYNKYFHHVPFGKISEILMEHGFNSILVAGVYIGDRGRWTAFVDDHERHMIVIEWYKMGSENYEVNTYVS